MIKTRKPLAPRIIMIIKNMSTNKSLIISQRVCVREKDKKYSPFYAFIFCEKVRNKDN